MFLGLPDPDPFRKDKDLDPLIRDTYPDPFSQIYGSGSFYHQEKLVKKNIVSYCVVTPS